MVVDFGVALRRPLAFFRPPPAELSAQCSVPARVTGEVTDQNGAPLSGVRIVIVNHDADDAELFLGLPRAFNLGFEIKF